MKDFGSDFHLCKHIKKGKSFVDIIGDANYYADGRHAIVSLINHLRLKRIWMPYYFCYEVIANIKRTGVEVLFYDDYPIISNKIEFNNSNFREDDALFLMNYYGLRDKRVYSNINIPIIEDHSHDLIGEWSLKSKADWCVASLRKTLPISEGGVLWSPKKHILPKKPSRTIENDYLSKKRFEAMKIKASYLNGENLVDKDGFRKLYIETEELFDNLPISLISDDSFQIIQDLDIKWWYELKKNNWKFLANHKYKNAKVLIPESDNSYPFTFVLKFDNNEIRNKFRFNLIENRIYPAILWSVPDSLDEKYSDFTDTMLSIHCDARYNLDDIKELYSKIISAIEFE